MNFQVQEPFPPSLWLHSVILTVNPVTIWLKYFISMNSELEWGWGCSHSAAVSCFICYQKPQFTIKTITASYVTDGIYFALLRTVKIAISEISGSVHSPLLFWAPLRVSVLWAIIHLLFVNSSFIPCLSIQRFPFVLLCCFRGGNGPVCVLTEAIDYFPMNRICGIVIGIVCIPAS